MSSTVLISVKDEAPGINSLLVTLTDPGRYSTAPGHTRKHQKSWVYKDVEKTQRNMEREEKCLSQRGQDKSFPQLSCGQQAQSSASTPLV